jgi:hypothetical protein
MNVISAKTAMRALGIKAQQITDNPLMTSAEKLTELKAMGVDLKRHQATIAMHEQSSRLMSGGSALGSDEGMAFGSQSFASSLKSARIPRLELTEEVTKALFDAATSKQSLRIETKATTCVVSPSGCSTTSQPHRWPGRASSSSSTSPRPAWQRLSPAVAQSPPSSRTFRP